MNDEVRRRMKDSSRRFLDIVWPACSPSVGGGRVVPVECSDSYENLKLDQLAGIDLWQVVDNGMGLRGVASRVQPVSNPTEHNTRTFTIRESGSDGCRAVTEWQKRQYALVHRDCGVISPYYTIHAYVGVPDETLIRAWIMRTEDLIRYVMESPVPIPKPGTGKNAFGIGRNVAGRDGKVFIYVDALSMSARKVDVKLVTGERSSVAGQCALF